MQTDVHSTVEAAIRKVSPDIIGVSIRNIDDQAMSTATLLLDPVKIVIADCRRMSGAPVVLGGGGYSIFPKTVLEYLGADMGIQGEGEAAFVLLLDYLGRNFR
ncbi:cobalamin B12-binding domain-containing protein [Desulfatirhabdium butyrativorans]|uniref:cobalamin B12-binding domain-containing protein n=1 Tax=Desulfatirhabdium butyrativorans TaxID=340467 RepID=UPI0003FB6E3D